MHTIRGEQIGTAAKQETHQRHQGGAPTDLDQSRFSVLGNPGQIGADERTRTFTPIKEQRPQRCASTNSATSALIWLGCGGDSEGRGRREGVLWGIPAAFAGYGRHTGRGVVGGVV